MQFKHYINESEKHMEAGDLQKTLHKIPKKHRDMMRGYSYYVQDGNTLKNDPEHIGENDLKNKKIILAAPWRYGRELAFLHEIGHIVYCHLSDNQKEAWKKLCVKTNMKQEDRQNAEELFCQAYGSTYSKHPPVTYYKPEWEKFIKALD